MDKKDSVSVCIIIAYFGQLPSNVKIWLKSCAWNPKVDFLVCSDVKKSDLPGNVRWINMTFSQFREMAEQKLQMKIQLETPYECCDFKAVYGIIFEDYLSGYDYWGYCDMDMVFGDLYHFFEKYELTKYDRFHHLGHLSLMRNTEENNNRYRLPCTPGFGYKDAFVSKGTTHFDEMEINRIFKIYGFPIFDCRICADISPQFKRMRISGAEIQNYNYQTFFWQNGKVWRAYFEKTATLKNICLDEFAYIHFQKREMKVPDVDWDKVDRFYITSNGYEVKEELGFPDLKTIKKLNPFRGKLFEDYEAFSFKVKRKIKTLTER